MELLITILANTFSLTINEIKLMSSFPKSFRLEGSFIEKWAGIGNGVPPLFMKAIAEHIRHNLFLVKSA